MRCFFNPFTVEEDNRQVAIATHRAVKEMRSPISERIFIAMYQLTSFCDAASCEFFIVGYQKDSRLIFTSEDFLGSSLSMAVAIQRLRNELRRADIKIPDQIYFFDLATKLKTQFNLRDYPEIELPVELKQAIVAKAAFS